MFVPRPALALLLLLAPALVSAGELRVEGAQLRDAAGGAVILRGVNVAGNSKVPPFRGITDPRQLDPLPGFGMNLVRLLFTWEAYEPEPGVYDAAYLDYYVTTARAAAARGLYVVVDFHQDAYSRFLSAESDTTADAIWNGEIQPRKTRIRIEGVTAGALLVSGVVLGVAW